MNNGRTPPPPSRQTMSDRLREIRERQNMTVRERQAQADHLIREIARPPSAAPAERKINRTAISQGSMSSSAARACPACKRKGATSRDNPKCRYCGHVKES